MTRNEKRSETGFEATLIRIGSEQSDPMGFVRVASLDSEAIDRAYLLEDTAIDPIVIRRAIMRRNDTPRAWFASLVSDLV